MTFISKVDLVQINRQLTRLDTLEKLVQQLQENQKNLKSQVSSLDFEHGKPTTNNMVFSWAGPTTKITWTAGTLMDKNATAQRLSGVPKSSAPGAVHNYPILAGSLTGITPSAYYWLAWEPQKLQMVASQDAGQLYQNKSLFVICQIFTGTAGQSGVAGGGGVNGVSDLSGLPYKMF
jgi:hypothetical protein